MKDKEYNNFNLILNSVIDENISDENTEYEKEFLADYVSGYNYKAQNDVEGTVNNIRGSFIIGSNINAFNIKQ